MMRWIRMTAAALLVAASLAPASAQDATAALTVKVSGLKGNAGVALVALYDNEDAWLKVPRALQVIKQKIAGKELTVSFKAVRPGTYGVSVIHDENKNNELDMRWFPYPKPKEGIGASNNPKSGPAKWDEAKFTVGAEGATVKIALKYFE